MRFIILMYSVIALTLIIVVSCNNSSLTPTESTTTAFPYETSLEEAERVLGVEIPSPAYLPQGYEIQRITIEDESLVVFTISNDSGDYMELSMHWNIIPFKPSPNSTSVDVNGTTGYLSTEDESNHICWNYWDDDIDKYDEGLFIMELSANKGLPIEELLLVVRSVY